jgi:hypothetical protein
VARVVPSSSRDSTEPEQSSVGAHGDAGSREDVADDDSEGEQSAEERKEGWPGPIEEPPPLFAG